MIMDYEQKYKGALERMRSWARGEHPECFTEAQKAAEFVFPELKESEDERIMKNIITFLDELFSLGKNANFDKWSKSDCAEWIAWLKKQGESYTKKDVDDAWLKGICDAKRELEKQGKQKHIVPKFKIGDTIKCKHDDRVFTIQSIDLEKGIYTYTAPNCGNDIDYADEEFELVEQNPVISYDALREGITHFGITQYQIDNWLKKYVDVEKQGESYTKKDVDDAWLKGICDAKRELEKQGEQKEINLVEILKHYPRETELYSPLYGKLWLAEVDEEHEIINCYRYQLNEGCVRAILEQEDIVSFHSNGTTGLPDFNISKDCMLFLYDVEKQGEQKSNDNVESTAQSYITPNQEFFQWIYDRLIYVHNENPNADYMLSLKERIKDMQKLSWSKEYEIGLDDALWAIEQAMTIAKDENDMGNLWCAGQWFKSLKDRFKEK